MEFAGLGVQGYQEALHGKLMAAGEVVVRGEQWVLVIQEVGCGVGFRVWGLQEFSGIGGSCMGW